MGVVFRLVACGSRVLFRVTQVFIVCKCVWFQRLSECLCQCCGVFSANSVVPVLWCVQCKQRCASVVMCSVQTAAIRRRLRTEDHCRRSSAQTVSLRPKQCRAEPLAFEGPSAGGWDGYSQQIRYAIAPTRSYHIGPVPGWYGNQQHRARQLCIWCGSRHDSGLSLRSSWTPCGRDFFY
jgi:hypothetical protein